MSHVGGGVTYVFVCLPQHYTYVHTYIFVMGVCVCVCGCNVCTFPPTASCSVSVGCWRGS